MRRLFTAVTLGGLLSAVASQSQAAAIASIQLRTDRETLLADGKNAAILSAEVRDDRGRVVPDGTLVRFSTTAGRLETATAGTRSGVARVTLIAADLPGTALVTANLDASAGLAAPAQLVITFSNDVEQAYRGSNWAQIAGNDYVGYAADFGVIQANGKDGGARVTYQDLEIGANALQVNVRDNTVRAEGGVILARGEKKRSYSNLRYDLKTRQGVGERDEDGRPVPVVVRGPDLEEERPESPPPDAAQAFALEDISGASVTIVARAIALEPDNRLQFRRATFYLDGAKTLSLPFHVMTLGQQSLFAEQIVGYGPQGFSVDFPLYYDVRPSAVGTLHVRHGARVGGGSVYSARPGWTLDLDQAYNRGSGVDGRFELTGVTRRDWGARWTHAQRLGAATRGQFYVDFPNHSDLFGNAQLSRSFSGFSVTMNASGSRSSVEDAAAGRRSLGDLRAQIYAETDARPVGAIRGLRYNLSLSSTRQGFYGPDAPGAYNLQTAGVRLSASPVALNRQTSLQQSYSLGQTWTQGSSAERRSGGASVQGTLALTHRMGRLGAGTLTYDYAQTPQFADTYGRHRLGGSLFLGNGDRWNLSLTGSQSLDTTFATLYGSLGFALSGPWRGRVTLSTSRVSGFGYSDLEYALIRRIGGRDISVYYSTSLRRVQVDLTGARF